MGSIDRYIFRTTLASFAVVLVSLTGVIWITQALRVATLGPDHPTTLLSMNNLAVATTTSAGPRTPSRCTWRC